VPLGTMRDLEGASQTRQRPWSIKCAVKLVEYRVTFSVHRPDLNPFSGRNVVAKCGWYIWFFNFQNRGIWFFYP
jgi:hypothetical protein